MSPEPITTLAEVHFLDSHESLMVIHMLPARGGLRWQMFGGMIWRIGFGRLWQCWAIAGYGLSGPFRLALTDRGLIWAVGIPCKQKVYPADGAMIFPVAGGGGQAEPCARRPFAPRSGDAGERKVRRPLAGGAVQGASCRRGLLPCACGWLTARRSASVTLANSIFPAKRSGWSASIAPPASANTTSAICPATRRSKSWTVPSKPVGSASRPTSSSRKSWWKARFLGTIMAGPPPTCPHEHDRVRLSASPPPEGSGSEKKSPSPPPQPTLPAIRQAIITQLSQPPPPTCPHCRRKWRKMIRRNLPK
jgi:hypothetical protein